MDNKSKKSAAARELAALIASESRNVSDVQKMLKELFKVRKEARVINKCLYTVLGINMDGRKEILGIWMSENESANFWTTVLNELKNRGVQDILNACRDNLIGFSGAIETVFPHTEQQLCVIHQIRNSTRYVSYKDVKRLMAELKLVYGAPTLDDAEYRLDEFREKWGKTYPQILKSWDSNWAELSTYFKYPQEVRTLIYTTNAVEGFHRQLRKFTKNRTMPYANPYIFRLCKSAKSGLCRSGTGENHRAVDNLLRRPYTKRGSMNGWTARRTDRMPSAAPPPAGYDFISEISIYTEPVTQLVGFYKA